jgi:BioD-like phosphotransacetylase family protein
LVNKKGRKNRSVEEILGVLFIVSAEEAVGKTALCAGLAINFLNDGGKVGYLKSTAEANGDAAFMKKIPGVDIVTKADFNEYDVALMEGRLGKSAADEASEAAYAAAKETKAKVIAVETYSGRTNDYIGVYQGFGKNLLGVVLNKVPQSQIKNTRDEAGARLEKAGIKLLGIIPENRVLLAITIGELADILKGKILNNEKKSAELVENYMLGALVVGSGLDYFGRKSRKAAIIRHDRPDMQLAALETSTACLVLSGGEKPPIPSVLFKAENRGIPIIATGTALNDIVTIIDSTLLSTRLNQTKKLDKLAETVRQNLDIKALTGRTSRPKKEGNDKPV